MESMKVQMRERWKEESQTQEKVYHAISFIMNNVNVVHCQFFSENSRKRKTMTKWRVRIFDYVFTQWLCHILSVAQGQFLSRLKLVWIQSFSSPWLGG